MMDKTTNPMALQIPNETAININSVFVSDSNTSFSCVSQLFFLQIGRILTFIPTLTEPHVPLVTSYVTSTFNGVIIVNVESTSAKSAMPSKN